MSAITLEDLAKLINKPPEKKPRKKTERTAKQELEMKERMAVMREKSLEARKKKSEGKKSELPVLHNKVEVTAADHHRPQAEVKQTELFEKHYASKLDKLDESMGQIRESLYEMKQMKKEKAEQRRKEKEEQLAKVDVPENLEKQEIKQPVNEIIKASTQQMSQGVVIPNPNKIPKNTNYKSFFKR